MASFPIDLDAEKIQFDGQWCSRDDLAKRIKAMLDGGDFQVTRPSQALEALNAMLANVKTLSVKFTPEQHEAIHQAASKTGKTPGALVRDALAAYFSGAARPPAAVPAAPTNGAGAKPATPAPSRPDIVTEDASPDDAAGAVSLTPKRKEEEGPVERGWFGT